MAITEQISLRLPTELLEVIDILAKQELRTRTNMIEFIITNWLREYTPPNSSVREAKEINKAIEKAISDKPVITEAIRNVPGKGRPPKAKPEP